MTTRKHQHPERNPFHSIEAGMKGCGKAINQERRHDHLLRIFKENTATPDFPLGRTTIAPHQEPTVHSLRGFERSRVRRYQFVPRDLP
jgi:hypothetical protein